MGRRALGGYRLASDRRQAHDVEPFAYLKDVLECMSGGHPMSRLDDLLPWNWTPSAAVAA
jgi:hypothetical protein